MKVYLAAPWKHRFVAELVAKQLRNAGNVVVSRWHDEWAHRDDSTVSDDQFRQEALYDYNDVLRSEIVMVLNIEKSEGKAVEQGIALAEGIPVLVVGDKTNVFHYLETFTFVKTVNEAVKYLGER